MIVRASYLLPCPNHDFAQNQTLVSLIHKTIAKSRPQLYGFFFLNLNKNRASPCKDRENDNKVPDNCIINVKNRKQTIELDPDAHGVDRRLHLEIGCVFKVMAKLSQNDKCGDER